MIDYVQHGRVTVLTINRPEARNAVNGEVAAGIEAAIDRIEADDDTWVAVLAGNGPVFSAGADLKVVDAGMDGLPIMTKRGGFGGICRRERTKPIIAAVDGPALAGGLEIVCACDLVVASSRATFGIPEVKRSLIAAAGGLFRLNAKLPPNVAMELALTGDPISAEQAHTFGLVNLLVEPGEVVPAALALAERVCANAPLAVRASRAVMLETIGLEEKDAWRVSNRHYAAVLATEDFKEGPRAFIEKRAPVWKGR